MKKIIVIVSMLLSVAAFAAPQEVTVSYWGHEGGNEHYYSCDLARATAESHLVKLGATEIEVNCSGGIQPSGSMQAIYLNATFNTPDVGDRYVEEVIEIRGDAFNPACGLNVAIIRQFLKVFSNVEVLKKTDSCAFQGSNFFYQLNVKH